MIYKIKKNNPTINLKIKLSNEKVIKQYSLEDT